MSSVVLNMLYMNFLMNVSPLTEASNNQSFAVNASSTEPCHDVYNETICFPLDGLWANRTSQPLAALPPAPPHLVDTVFYLFSRHNFSFPIILDPAKPLSIINSRINKNKSIKIISHGYLSSGRTSWIKAMTGEFLRADEENIIVVDWYSGARPPYVQAVANIRLVGVQVAKFVYALMKYADVPASSFHLIGHSLGAHLFGHCGTFLRDVFRSRLGRITGLDPAGPLFEDTTAVTRLDPSDAHFVDVIHTAAVPILGFPLSKQAFNAVGMSEPIGHMDFYPNGGREQPECDGRPYCQHKRASELFVASIRQSCSFMAVRCDSYDAFVQGGCFECNNGTNCSLMGEKATPLATVTNEAKFYLLTRGDIPFCGQQYRVSFAMSNSTAAQMHGGEFAIISVQLKGIRETTELVQLSKKSVFFNAGMVHRRVVLATDVGRVTSVTASLSYPGSMLFPFSWRLKRPVVHAHSVTVERLSLIKPTSCRFCFDEELLPLNEKYELTAKNLC